MRNKKRVLVTGGGGFIGSHFIYKLLSDDPNKKILNLDSISYATSKKTLELFNDFKNYRFQKIDINNYEELLLAFIDFQPDIVVHFAAESHVDNSLAGPKVFLETNIMGTFNLLQASLEIKKNIPSIMFHHVSTDEVYGDLAFHAPKFTEDSNFKPSSPYSASKASSDLLVQSWARTFNLNYIITNCSNNFGARQHSEKLIPTVIKRILSNKKIPIYGNGLNIRDWIFAKDHANAIISIHDHNLINERINIGGNNEIANISLVNKILEMMDCSDDLIEYIDDRPGHDLRYAIDNSKIYSLTNWKPSKFFDENLQETINWYQKNSDWWES